MAKNRNRRKAHRAASKKKQLKLQELRTETVKELAEQDSIDLKNQRIFVAGSHIKKEPAWFLATVFSQKQDLALNEEANLFHSSLSITMALMANQSLDKVAKEIGRVFDAEEVAFYFDEQAPNEEKLQRSWGRYRKILRDSAIPVESLLTQEVHENLLVNGELIHISDVPRDRTLGAPIAALREFGSFVALPLYLNGSKVSGILMVARAQVASFRVEDISILKDLALDLGQDRWKSQYLRSIFTCETTNLLSKSAILFLLERDLTRSERLQRKSALLLFEIDELFQYSLHFEKPAVENMLSDFSVRLQQATRASEWLAYLGAGVFAMLLFTEDEQQVDMAVRRLFQQACAHEFKISEENVYVKLFGGVCMTSPQQSSMSVLQTALTALSVAKKQDAPSLYVIESDDYFQDRILQEKCDS